VPTAFTDRQSMTTAASPGLRLGQHPDLPAAQIIVILQVAALARPART
jgi:hypothetical protein